MGSGFPSSINMETICTKSRGSTDTCISPFSSLKSVTRAGEKPMERIDCPWVHICNPEGLGTLGRISRVLSGLTLTKEAFGTRRNLKPFDGDESMLS